MLLPTNLESIGLSVQETNGKIDFKDSHHGGHLGFLIKMIIAIFIYKLPRYFLPSFKSIGLSVEETKAAILDFQSD